MKAIRTLIIGIMMLIGTSAFAQPMNYNAIRNNARFLTDRMAYTLGIANMDIIDDIYRINYDYIYGVNAYLDDIALGYRYDDYLAMCAERDYALRMLLGEVMWSRIIGYDYFYRPIIFENRRWRFGIYAHDYNRGYYHYSVPRYYNDYRGGHFIGVMHHSHGIGTRGPGMVHIERRGNQPNHHMNGGHPGGDPHMNGGRPGNNSSYGNSHTGNRTGNYNGNYNHNGGRSGNNDNYGGRPGNNDNYNNGNHSGNMNQGGQPGGNYNRGEANRSESNVRSSSRSGSYGSPSRSDNSYGSSRSGSSYNSSTRSSSSYGSSTRSSSSYGSSTRSGSSSSSRSSSMSAPTRSGNTGGSMRGGNGGGVSHGRR